jgi:hypothetical protein
MLQKCMGGGVRGGTLLSEKTVRLTKGGLMERGRGGVLECAWK